MVGDEELIEDLHFSAAMSSIWDTMVKLDLIEEEDMLDILASAVTNLIDEP